MAKKKKATKAKASAKKAVAGTGKKGMSLSDWIRSKVAAKPELKAEDIRGEAERKFPKSKTVVSGFPQMVSMTRLRMLSAKEIKYSPRRPLTGKTWDKTEHKGTGGKSPAGKTLKKTKTKAKKTKAKGRKRKAVA